MFAGVFATDKQLATFMGRPPALSRRYVTSQLPLDLSDQQILTEGEELAANIGKLDSNGWNTDGEVYPATVSRAWMTMSVIRDEVLELCLGPVPESPSTRRE